MQDLVTRLKPILPPTPYDNVFDSRYYRYSGLYRLSAANRTLHVVGVNRVVVPAAHRLLARLDG
jgi:hypothetical protein